MGYTPLAPPNPPHKCDPLPDAVYFDWSFIQCDECGQVYERTYYYDPRPGESTFYWTKIETPEWAKE